MTASTKQCAQFTPTPNVVSVCTNGFSRESFSLLTKRMHKSAAPQMIGALRSSLKIEVVAVSRELQEAGWERCRRFADNEWDWIDCVSFEFDGTARRP